MMIRMFADFDGRTHATSADADDAFREVIARYDDAGHYRYLIVEDSGRFFPVFLPSRDQIQLAIELAQWSNIPCIGMSPR